MKPIASLFPILCFLFVGTTSLLAGTTAERLHDSTQTLQEILSAPDRGIPADLLAKSQCIVIVPGLKKAAFVVGAKYGKGFITCRKPGGVGWGGPAAIRIEGGSFGFQIGASETDVVMLVMNRSGVNRLLQSKFTLGGAAEVAAGPVGRSSTAQTDAKLTAQILSYSRSRGVFAGVSLQGATLREDLDENQQLYGQRYSNRDIVMNGSHVAAGSSELIALLNRYSSRS